MCKKGCSNRKSDYSTDPIDQKNCKTNSGTPYARTTTKQHEFRRPAVCCERRFSHAAGIPPPLFVLPLLADGVRKQGVGTKRREPGKHRVCFKTELPNSNSGEQRGPAAAPRKECSFRLAGRNAPSPARKKGRRPYCPHLFLARFVFVAAVLCSAGRGGAGRGGAIRASSSLTGLGRAAKSQQHTGVYDSGGENFDGEGWGQFHRRANKARLQ